MKDEVITSNQLAVVGILTPGRLNNRLPTIIIFNAGVIHRVGPNRTYVKLARKLASEGFNVFRFDYGGQGDSLMSLGENANKRYLADTLEILEKKVKFNEFILMGICTGAEAAYNVALSDNRVKGVVMINGSGLGAEQSKKLYGRATKMIQIRYYKKALRNPRKWLKILTGKSGAVKFLSVKKILSPFFTRKTGSGQKSRPVKLPNPFEKILEKNIKLLLVISEGSPAFDLIRMVCGSQHKFDHVILNDVDHTITPIWAQNEMHSAIISWCNKKFQ